MEKRQTNPTSIYLLTLLSSLKPALVLPIRSKVELFKETFQTHSGEKSDKSNLHLRADTPVQSYLSRHWSRPSNPKWSHSPILSRLFAMVLPSKISTIIQTIQGIKIIKSIKRSIAFFGPAFQKENANCKRKIRF